MDTNMLAREKIEQATGILKERNLDCWLTFVRETTAQSDPALQLIADFDLTWPSALIITRKGETIAIVGRYDADVVRESGLYTTLLTYDEDISETLVATLSRLNPHQVAINFSLGDVTADGLTHGMFLQLAETLAPTPYIDRLISSGPIISSLRARKTASELQLMRKAIAITEEIYAKVGTFLQPGRTERQIAGLMHDELKRRGLSTAWPGKHCPIVQAGPEACIGHSSPTDRIIRPGMLVHIDFGVSYQGYCSDMQRMWYMLEPGENQAPEPLRHAFQAAVTAIETGKAALRPGVPGYEVDAAARATLVSAGYPEYKHALGHTVGRYVHDGGPLLGPRWPRYGETPEQRVEADSVFTLELGMMTGRGYIGLEDEVLVTPRGAEWISPFQRELRYVSAG
jgi:Xaa-Pro aminopeptidase